MGLFDSLAKQVLGNVLGGTEQGSSLQAMLAVAGKPTEAADSFSSLLESVGGLEGLKSKFEAADLGGVFSSWTGSGSNESVQPDQLQKVLGSQVVQEFAAKLNLPIGSLMPMLAQFLPMVIDQLTPKGQVEENHPSKEAVQNVIGSLIQGALGKMM